MMIRRLHAGLGIPGRRADRRRAELSIDSTVDYAKFPLAEMQERPVRTEQAAAPVPEGIRRGAGDGLFGARQAWAGQPVMMRATLHQTGPAPWTSTRSRSGKPARCERHAMALKGAYQHGVITSEWIRNLTRLSTLESGPLLAQEYLSNHGIALVFERHFDKTYLDGRHVGRRGPDRCAHASARPRRQLLVRLAARTHPRPAAFDFGRSLYRGQPGRQDADERSGAGG